MSLGIEGNNSPQLDRRTFIREVTRKGRDLAAFSLAPAGAAIGTAGVDVKSPGANQRIRVRASLGALTGAGAGLAIHKVGEDLENKYINTANFRRTLDSLEEASREGESLADDGVSTLTAYNLVRFLSGKRNEIKKLPKQLQLEYREACSECFTNLAMTGQTKALGFMLKHKNNFYIGAEQIAFALERAKEVREIFETGSPTNGLSPLTINEGKFIFSRRIPDEDAPSNRKRYYSQVDNLDEIIEVLESELEQKAKVEQLA